MTKGHNVRLTTQAHRLCAEEAKEAKTSMKAIASEAIFLLAHGNREEADEDMFVLRRTIYQLEQEIENKKWHSFRMFALGAIVSACFGIIFGVIS